MTRGAGTSRFFGRSAGENKESRAPPFHRVSHLKKWGIQRRERIKQYLKTKNLSELRRIFYTEEQWRGCQDVKGVDNFYAAKWTLIRHIQKVIT